MTYRQQSDATLEALETAYSNAHARYVAAEAAYDARYGSEIEYLSARAACIEAGRALQMAYADAGLVCPRA